MRISHAVLCLQSACSVVAGYAQTTAINYSGALSETGEPATGSYEYEFDLFDAGTGGATVTGPMTRSSVAVRSGLLSAELDFGSARFDGSERWLEIRVRPQGSMGAYVPCRHGSQRNWNRSKQSSRS